MVLYYVIAFFCVLSVLLKGKIGKFIGWSVFALMCVMTIFRGDEVGTDTMAYLMYSADYRVEEYIISGVVYLITQGVVNERAIIYFTGVVTYFFIYLLIRRSRIDIRYFLLFFFIDGWFVMGLNIARQIAAISIIAYFLPCIFNDKWTKRVPFFAGCIVAAGFHISSLFVLPLYFCRYIHLSRESNVRLIIIMGGILLLNVVPINSLMKLCLPDVYSQDYTDLLAETASTSFIGFLYKCFWLFIYVYMYKYIYRRKDQLLFVISAIIVNATFGMEPIISRIFLVYSFLLVFYSSVAFTEKNLKQDRMLKKLFFILLLIGLYMRLSSISVHPDLKQFEFIQL